MAINWTAFNSDLITIFDSSNGYDTPVIAQEIEDSYISAVEYAVENTAGNVLTPNTLNEGMLKSGIETSLNLANSAFGNAFDITGFNSGLASLWSTAKFDPVIPAAGQSVVNSIDVTSGGTGSSQVPPPPSDSNVPWVTMMIAYFQSHSPTVSGILTGVSSANGSPLLVPFSGIT